MGFWAKHFKLYQALKRMGIRDPRYILGHGSQSEMEKSISEIRRNSITDFGGFKMDLSPESPQDISYNVWRLNGIGYEKETAMLFRKSVKKTDTFLDIGSNSGYFALSMAGLCDRVMAFEPMPDVYRRLEANIKLNNFRNVQAFNIAVSDKKEKTTFYMDEHNDGGGSLSAGRQSEAERKPIEIQTDTLDNILNGHKADVIKIDTEGFEYEVLKGGTKTIGQARLIVFEHNMEVMAHRGAHIEKNQVIKLLEQNGFSVRSINANGTPGKELHDYKDAPGLAMNLCAIRS
jgi:FkbM family methyltransferase